MSEVTVREAAERLGVDVSRVRQLLTAGTLEGRRLGRQWLVSSSDLDRHQALTRSGVHSRAFSARIAWAAGALLDGRDAGWLTKGERSRLVARLAGADGTAIFQRWLRMRHEGVTRYRVGDTDIASLLREGGVVATGLSAARHYGQALGAANEAEAYATADVLDRLVRHYVLVASDRGNLLLHRVNGDWHLRTSAEQDGARVAPRLMTAVDLLDGGDARLTAAGRALLEQAVGQGTAARSSGRRS